MRLADAVASIPDFDRWNHADKIKYFAWYLYTYRDQEYFSANDIRECFEEIGIAPPASINPFIGVMEKRTPKEAFKTPKGYRLDKRLRVALDARYGEREATIHIPKSLAQLAAKVDSEQEREYLDEIFSCFKHRAFRAVMVMAWELAYMHIVNWIVRDAARLNAFNARLEADAKKRAIRTVADFLQLREDQVLDAAAKARILSASIRTIIDDSLHKRNEIVLSTDGSVRRSIAERFVKDIVGKVVLALS
jgi:hypothetical protein